MRLATPIARRSLVLVATLALASSAFASPASGITTPSTPNLAFPTPKISGPFFGAPVFPRVFDGSLTNLPIAKPGPVTSFPIGNLSAGAGSAFSSQPGVSVPRAGGANDRSGDDGGAAIDFSDTNPNYDGLADLCCPEDPIGDAGPNHYIQMVNSSFQIFDKAGTSLAGPSRISTLWTAAGDTGDCANNDSGDPVVKYDHLADRWLMSQFALPNGLFNAPSSECIAISQTADPVNGGWFVYTFRIPGDRLDYPKIGVWPDAYYMSSQQGYSGGSLDAWAWDRANMLAGTFVTPMRFTIAGPAITLLPADLDGPAPAAGTPAPFARMLDGALWGGADRVEVYHLSVDWSNPPASTFTMVASLGTTFDSDMCSGNNLTNNCVPQPGSATLLETLTVWPMQPLQYRTFGTHDTLVFTHSVDADGADHAGVRWYELRRTPAGAGAWTIFQGATHAPDGGSPGLADDPHRWMGSAALNGDGDMAVGYSVSDGTSVFPGIRYAGRLATDALNTLPQGEFTLVNGGGTSGATRWGDYSAMSVDPVDDCTFWYTAAYVSGSGRSTRIGAFKFPSCARTISIDDVSEDEGNAGTTPLTFTVSLSGPSGTVVTVDYDTADGSATTADGDYSATTGTVTFAPGDTSETVTVHANGDVTFEPDEDFFVNLSNATGADIADGQGRGEIRNDDPQPQISIDDPAAFEGNAGLADLVFTTSLSNPSFQTITTAYATADGTATVADADYSPAAGTVTFDPGDTSEPVPVPVQGDIAVEPDETFFVNLSGATNATYADDQGQGTILNDDLSANVDCTITGTNKDDVLVGTAGDDVICGGNGDDHISGLGGNDVLIGGNGRDVLLGGDGHDLLLGGNGRDVLDGGAGNDNLQGGNGQDMLTGGAGSDHLQGDNADDQLNTMDGVPGNDAADGGRGTDICTTDPGDATTSCP